MRYRLIMLPFLDRYHVTLTTWDQIDPERSKRVEFWDIGPDDVDTGQVWAILTYVAGDLAGSNP